MHCSQVTNQLTFCAWLYPFWSRWAFKLGAFEIRTTETLYSEEKIVTVCLSLDKSGLTISAAYVHLFKLNVSIASVNILRIVCIFYDNITYS